MVDMKTKPPSVTIADDIRRKILAGAYRQGRLPSERALIRSYGISRSTAAKALSFLEGEGLIVRRHGSGRSKQRLK